MINFKIHLTVCTLKKLYILYQKVKYGLDGGKTVRILFGRAVANVVLYLLLGDDARSESISIVSSEVAADRIDRGGEETEEEPLVNGFADLSMR